MPGFGDPPVATQFAPGNNANPGGKPKGARNRLTRHFLNKLAKDFEEHGDKAIRECRENDPAAYLKVVAGLCPKEVEANVRVSLADLLTSINARRAATRPVVEQSEVLRSGRISGHA